MATRKKQFKNTIFILDTCIVQYIDNKSLTKEITDLIMELSSEGSGNVLNISDFTVMEALTGAKQDREAQIRKTLELFARYAVDTNALITSAQLSAVYTEDEDGLSNNGIGIGDRIIAATSILTTGIIVTANGRHFPRPFFNEVHRIDTELRGQKITLYFLKPNMELVNSRFINRKR